MAPVHFAPNGAAIRARILSMRAAADGWGAWAEIEVLETAPSSSELVQTHAAGRMRVFVPPRLVASIHPDTIFEGEITYSGGPRTGVYAFRMRRN